MHAPEFWARDGGGGAIARTLAPLGAAYGLAGKLRNEWVTPWRAPVPVVCVGNLVAGGAGKTPTALALAARFARAGRRVHLLARGYGGREAGPLRVDPARHDARAVGDEALLLARAAPSWIARDRIRGARAAVEAGAEVIVMDDGLQNPSLEKDVSLVVVDGGFGFGNGRLIPAGPLREPIARGLARADALVLIGEDRTGVLERLAPGGPPVLRAELVPGPEAETLAGRAVVAFAGIGRPEKFFETLDRIGCNLVSRRGFADHHRYRASEIARLAEAARAANAVLVTTEKDATRLPPGARDGVLVLTVSLAWDEPQALDGILTSALGAAGAPGPARGSADG